MHNNLFGETLINDDYDAMQHYARVEIVQKNS